MYHVEIELDKNGYWIAYVVSEKGNVIAGFCDNEKKSQLETITKLRNMVNRRWYGLAEMVEWLNIKVWLDMDKKILAPTLRKSEAI